VRFRRRGSGCVWPFGFVLALVAGRRASVLIPMGLAALIGRRRSRCFAIARRTPRISKTGGTSVRSTIGVMSDIGMRSMPFAVAREAVGSAPAVELIQSLPISFHDGPLFCHVEGHRRRRLELHAGGCS